MKFAVAALFLLTISSALDAKGVEIISTVHKYIQDPTLKCSFKSTPTYVEVYEACVGNVYCADKTTGIVKEKALSSCKPHANGECRKLEDCADPANAVEITTFEPAELSERTADDKVNKDKHGRTCRYDTGNPMGLWIQHKGSMYAMCGTPLNCDTEKPELPSFAVCEAIDPPTKPELTSPENLQRQPFRKLECPRVNRCINKPLKARPAEIKSGSAETLPGPTLTNQPTTPAPRQAITSPSTMTTSSAKRPSGSVARGVRSRLVPQSRGASKTH